MRSLKSPKKWSQFFVWALVTPGIKTLISWCIIDALIAFPIAFNEGEHLLFKYFCPPGILLDAIWFHGLDAPVLDLLALMCSLDLIFFSTGNWYLFCASLVYCRWNIGKFFAYWVVKMKRQCLPKWEGNNTNKGSYWDYINLCNQFINLTCRLGFISLGNVIHFLCKVFIFIHHVLDITCNYLPPPHTFPTSLPYHPSLPNWLP